MKGGIKLPDTENKKTLDDSLEASIEKFEALALLQNGSTVLDLVKIIKALLARQRVFVRPEVFNEAKKRFVTSSTEIAIVCRDYGSREYDRPLLVTERSRRGSPDNAARLLHPDVWVFGDGSFPGEPRQFGASLDMLLKLRVSFSQNRFEILPGVYDFCRRINFMQKNDEGTLREIESVIYHERALLAYLDVGETEAKEIEAAIQRNNDSGAGKFYYSKVRWVLPGEIINTYEALGEESGFSRALYCVAKDVLLNIEQIKLDDLRRQFDNKITKANAEAYGRQSVKKELMQEQQKAFERWFELPEKNVYGTIEEEFSI